MAITHDPKRNIKQRMHCVMNEIDYVKRGEVPKAGTGVFYDHLLELVRPILLAHGVYWYTTQVGEGRFVEPTEKAQEKNGNLMIYKGRYATHFCNIDGEDEIVVEHEGQGNDFGDKGPGKSATYSAKMNLLRGLGLISGIQDEARLPGEGDETRGDEQGVKPDAIATPQRKAATEKAATPAADPATSRVVNLDLKQAIEAISMSESAGAASKGLVAQIKAAANSKGVAKIVKGTLAEVGVDVDAMTKEVAAGVWKWIGDQQDPAPKTEG